MRRPRVQLNISPLFDTLLLNHRWAGVAETKLYTWPYTHRPKSRRNRYYRHLLLSLHERGPCNVHLTSQHTASLPQLKRTSDS